MVDDAAVCDDFAQTQLQVHFSLRKRCTKVDMVLVSAKVTIHKEDMSI